MDKEYRKLSSLKGWDKNPRSIKGQFMKGVPPYNKVMGMSSDYTIWISKQQ